MTNDRWEENKEWRRQWTEIRAEGIARELTKIDATSWRIKPCEDEGQTYHYPPRLISDQGDSLSLLLDDHKRRVAISGNYGQTLDGRVWRPRDARLEDESPSMDGAKTDAQIAADIKRRFLRAYRVCLEAYRESIEASRVYRNGIEALHDELVTLSRGALAPDSRTDRARNPERTISLYHVKGISYGDLRICSADSVRLECSISPDLARKFVAMLERGNGED